MGLSIGCPQVAADPLPGFDLSAEKLQARMQDCMEFLVDKDYLLMGWIKVSTGEHRHWRCSSLRHMILDPRAAGPHDPFVDVESFLRCVDKVVSYGFPRRVSGHERTHFITQYRGTKGSGHVVVQDSTGDIATIYTDPNNDWAGCAYWHP
jgi:hypothetical protein